MKTRRWPASTGVRLMRLALKLSKMGVPYRDVSEEIADLGDSPLHQAGAKASEAGAEGNRVRGELARRQANEHWQPRCDELHARNPHRSWTDICQAVANEFGVSKSTVYRHCKKPPTRK